MFKIGSKVKWMSVSAGVTKEKVGEVVAVVKAGTDFAEIHRDLEMEHHCRSAYGGGRPRDHESYAVRVPHHGKGKSTLYWPRVSALESA